jgi:hypothetical protein
MARDERFERLVNFVLQWEVVRDKQGNVVAEEDADDPRARRAISQYCREEASHSEIPCRLAKSQQRFAQISRRSRRENSNRLIPTAGALTPARPV